MKSKKIYLLLSITSIATILPVVSISAISCNKNITNSNEEIVNPKPDTPEINNPIPPVDIIVDTNPSDSETEANPTISNLSVNILNNGFEIVIEGNNLPLNVNLYLFRVSPIDNPIFAQEIKNDSTNTKVTLIVTDPIFQNKNLNMVIKFGDNNQYNYYYPNPIKFEYFETNENQFNEYVQEFENKMNQTLTFVNESLDIYDWTYRNIDSIFNLTTNDGIRITGSKKLQTLPLWM